VRAASADAYRRAGAEVKEAKSVVGSRSATAGGAEVRGREGVVGAPRSRRADLAVLTLELVVLGVASRDLVRRLVGTWVAILLYRRPLLALLGECFTWAGSLDPEVDPWAVVRLPIGVADELMSLALYAPLAETNVRAPVSTKLVATDASLRGGGVVSTEIPDHVAQEMWRHRERRGMHVRLDDPTRAFFAERAEQRFLDMLPAEPEEAPALWASELIESLQFHTELEYTFRRFGSHINCCEHRVRRSWLRQASQDPANHGTRRLGVLDSRVTIGSAAKGRSSSRAMNHERRKSMSYLVGPDIYEGLLFGDTARNPADGPSRGRPPPLAQPPRPWVDAFMRGDRGALDERLARTWKPDPNETSGEADHPGPRVGGEPRPELDLRQRARGIAQTRAAYDGYLERFQAWLRIDADAWAALLEDSRRLDDSLVAYAQMLYDSRAARSEIGGTLRALGNKHRWLKRLLPHAWAAHNAWEAEEPGQSHRPMPAVALLAGVAVAISWRWLDVALLLLLAFDGALRPSDFLQLRRRDLRLPSDLASDSGEAYVVMEASTDGGVVAGPKTRFSAARRQQAQLDDPLLIAALEQHWGARPRDSFLLACGADKPTAERRFRSAFNAVFTELGFSVRDGLGLTPASLRAGGATHLFRVTQDITAVRWRGRWTNERSLEHYLQEMAAAEVMSELAPAVRSRVLQLARAAPEQVARCFLPYP